MATVEVKKVFPSYELVKSELTGRPPLYRVTDWWGAGPGIIVKKSDYAAALIRLKPKSKKIIVKMTYGSLKGVLLAGGGLLMLFLAPKMKDVTQDVVAALTEAYG